MHVPKVSVLEGVDLVYQGEGEVGGGGGRELIQAT